MAAIEDRIDFKGIVSEHEQQLTDADLRIVREVLANPTEAAFLSVADIARRAGVHQASAVRLAKKLGYSGYPHLRDSLRAEVVRASEPAERIKRRLASLESGDVIADLIRSEAESLLRVEQHVSQAALDAAADMLLSARRVYVFARGHATSLVELMERRLRRIGIETSRVTAEGRDLVERVLSIGAEDAVLAFALHRTPKGLVPLLELAHDRGAGSVLVSDVTGPLIRPRAKVLLAAPRGVEEEFQTLLVPMTIANALVLTMAQRDTTRSIQALERLSELIERFEGEIEG